MEVVFRRNRIKELGTGKEGRLYNLFKQYDAKAGADGINLVSLMDRVVKKSLEIINQGKTWMKYKIVNIKLIHKLLQENWSQPYKRKKRCLAIMSCRSRHHKAQKLLNCIIKRHIQ